MLNGLSKKIFRMLNPISVTDLLNIKPISTDFGFKRGTPVDRYYIERFLKENQVHIKGNILEIAENTYSKKFSKENQCAYSILNYVPSKNTTIVGDLTKPDTLPENEIDCFICTQTFNFIYNIQNGIIGAHHLLKKNGVLLATVAGLAQISRYDMDKWGDYWRFTDLSIRKLTEEVFGKGHVKVFVYGNILGAISMLQGIAVEDLPDKALLNMLDEDYQIMIGVVAIK